MAGKEILVVAGDRGGWNALESPLSLALDAGCFVHVYFVGTCAEQFANGKLRPDVRMRRVQAGTSDPEKIARLFRRSKYDLLVVGASQSSEGAIAASHALTLSKTVPRLGVQDMYGSSMPTLRLAKHLIDCLCVTDEFASNLVLREFPDLLSRVVVTGGPQFDKTAVVKKNWGERRKELRRTMRAENGQKVFLVVGGINGTAEMLEILEKGIEQLCLSKSPKVILRTHPRATDEDRSLLDAYMQSTKRRDWFADVGCTVVPITEDLLPGVDYVLSGYSTVNYFGIIYEMPGVMYVGTPAFRRDLMTEKRLKLPPEVENGAGWYVETADDVSRVITTVRQDLLTGRLLDIKRAQSRISVLNDGNAADRVWQQMQKLMVGC